MSLRIWLPLNGTLDNQGLEQVVAMNTNVVYANGKIGKCLSSNSSSSIVNFNIPNLASLLANGKKYSLACWIKLTNNTSSGWVIKFGSNSCGLWWARSSPRLVWNENDDGKRSATSIASDYNNWHHVVTTVDKSASNTIKLVHYVDGILSDVTGQTFDNSAFLQPTGETLTLYPYNALLNDIRLYDHILSPFEVKQISQGLILHYPLNNNGFGQENLLIDTLKDKNKTHTTYSISDFNFSEHLVEGEKYTITASVTTSSEKTFVGIYHSSGSYSMSGWMKVNEDGFYQKTFTATANMANRTQGIGYGFCRVYVSNNPSGGQSSYTLAGTANVNWIKIEKGTKATPWGPNKSDALYNNNIEYDCSGYQKNGEKIGIDYNSDTPKYDVSSVFSASPSIVKISNQNYAIQGSQNMTISVWAYKEDWSQYSERIYSCTQSGGFNIQSSGSNMQWSVAVYTNAEKTSHKYASSSPNLYILFSKTDLSSGWHMFTWIYTTEGTFLYIDGILKKSMLGTSYGLYFNSTAPLVLGGQASAKSYTSPYLNGKLSDFRIYCTALSAEDILALYKNSVYIDNEGNLYGAELREV